MRQSTVHVARNGETLAKVAALRKGVTPEDLAWLNNIPADARLRVGQEIKVPTQGSRDAARDAKNRFLALDYYMQTHDGRLPPMSHICRLCSNKCSGKRHSMTCGQTGITTQWTPRSERGA